MRYRTPKYQIEGQRFDKLVAIKEVERKNDDRRRYLFRCDCGNLIERDIRNVIRIDNGHSNHSCGCARIKKTTEINTKHGAGKRTGKRPRLYNIWIAMKQRCNNPKHDMYHRYGGRGIQVCEEWQKEYMPFRDWAMANGYQEGLQIDRIDNDGNYESSNCRWVTNKENQQNRTNGAQPKAKSITYKGEEFTVYGLAKHTGIQYETLKRRINRGWSVEDAIEIPPGVTRKEARKDG